MQTAMTDTTVAEIADAVDRARRDFIDLSSRADEGASVLDGHWTVHDAAAHVVTVSQRYVRLAEEGYFRRAEAPREVDRINDEELAAVRDRPMTELLGQLETDAPVIRDLAERRAASGARVPFHGGAAVDGVAGFTNWLGELRIHGLDIARAVGAPWRLPERDMLLVVSALQQIVPGYLDHARADGQELMVELRLPDARPWVMHIRDGQLESRPRLPEDRPHAVIRCRASTLSLVFYGRIGLLAAARRGMLVVGGTRPWRALTLPGLFHQP